MSAEDTSMDRDPDRVARKLGWLIMDTELKLRTGTYDLQYLLEDLLGRLRQEEARLDPTNMDPDLIIPTPAYPLVQSIDDIRRLERMAQ